MGWIQTHKWQAALLGLLVLGCIGLVAWLSILYMTYQSAVVVTATPPSVVEATPTPTPDPLGPYSVLLLGHGGPGHDGGLLTDTIMLAYIQPRKESIHLISIPRDLWVELPLFSDGKTKGYKVNAAYAVGRDTDQYRDRPKQFSGDGGGGSLAKYAVSQITGLQPTYFLAVNFIAFEQAIDELGGIVVRVPEGFDDPYYPLPQEQDNTCEKTEEEIEALTATLSGDLLDQQFTCRYEHLFFDAGKQEMDGETALKYVRSRHSLQAGSDFSRAERQQAVIEAVEEKVVALNFFPKVIPLVQSLSRNIQTDIDTSTLSELIIKAPELQKFEIQHVVLSESNVLEPARSSDGQYILKPTNYSTSQWQDVHQFIAQQLQ